MKTALQIYSIRDTLFSDVDDRLRQVKDMGYDGAEIVDFGGDSLKRIIDGMRGIGLELFSVHTSLDKMEKMDEAELIMLRQNGCRVMPIGSLPDDYRPGGEHYAEAGEVIAAYSALCAKHDIRLVYHNHEFDFAWTDGKRQLDVLLADFAPGVLDAELDTCWIYTGGEDPLEYLKKYAGRCPVLHLKDCVAEGGRRGFLPVGDGVISFPPILRAAPECGVEWLCVEQDMPSGGMTSMACAQRSLNNLRQLLAQ